MRNLPTRENCCGCSACVAICPKAAIRMLPDEEGFPQPVVDVALCVRCGACERVCPAMNQSLPRKPLACHIARSKDDKDRLKSSSGGIFPVFARHVLSKGGKVYGVAWKTDPFRAAYVGVSRVEDLDALRGSKYVQAEMGMTYREVRTDLQRGIQVLFTGCPCQIAGLRRFLGRDYDNLVTQEVICNSVPSPRAFELWVKAEQRKVSGGNLLDVNFRDKSKGWHSASFTITYETSVVSTKLETSAYYQLWQQGYSVRRCCIECGFRDFKSGADLTIGDFWGVEAVKPEYDDNKGVSAVLVNTARGAAFWRAVSGGDEIQMKSVSFDAVIPENPCLHKSFDIFRKAGNEREVFWTLVNAGADIQELGAKLTQDPLLVRLRRRLGSLLRKVGLRK